MAQMKRTVIVASAMVALTACAPAGYEGANPGAANPVAVTAAEPTAAAEPSVSPSPAADAPPPTRT